MPKPKNTQVSVAESQQNITLSSFHFYRHFNSAFNKWLKSKQNADLLFDWQCLLYSGCLKVSDIEPGMFYDLAKSILYNAPNRDELLADSNTLDFISSIIKRHPIYRANIHNAQIGSNDPDVINAYLMSQLSGAVLEAVNNPSEKTQANVLRSYFAMTAAERK